MDFRVDVDEPELPELPSRGEADKYVKMPHELWKESGGDPQKYRELMIAEGHLRPVTDENRPAEHVFKGLTHSCFCTECGAAYGASWHVEMVSGGAAGGGKTEAARNAILFSGADRVGHYDVEKREFVVERPDQLAFIEVEEIEPPQNYEANRYFDAQRLGEEDSYQ